jgi:hypothetical protein
MLLLCCTQAALLSAPSCAAAGEIPRWISDCFPHLKELDLSFNQLSGSIPSWLPNMGNHLLQIKLQQNNLSGRIPEGMLGSMPLLKVLWLHHNNLEGPLPSDMGRLQSLIRCGIRRATASGCALCGC